MWCVQVCGLLCVSGVVGVVCECVRSGDEALVTRAIHLLDSLAAGQSAAHTPRVYGAKACEALLRAGVAEALGQAQRQHEQVRQPRKPTPHTNPIDMSTGVKQSPSPDNTRPTTRPLPM